MFETTSHLPAFEAWGGTPSRSLSADTNNGAVRAVIACLRADNAGMMAGLSAMVAAPYAEIPAAVRPMLIADIRRRHTEMPAGREISHRMQRYMERALMQARLHLMGDPGARAEFEVSVAQYRERLEIRCGLAQAHLGRLSLDARTLTGALEWCELLVIRHTPQELKGAHLQEAAQSLDDICEELGTKACGDSILSATVDYLAADGGPTLKAAERVRRALQQGCVIMDDGVASEAGTDGFRFRPRRLA